MESENGKPLFTKRLLLIVVAVILLVLIVFLLLKRCGNGGNSKVEQITLTPTRVNLKVGEQQQVYSNVYPEDAKDSSVYWDSEDPTIASVDQNGVVTGINNGVTTITAKANDDGGAVGSTTVTVGDDLPELEQIQLNKSIYTVYVGSTVLIEATPVPSTAQLLDIKYSTRDTNIATVDDSGRIKGVKVGSTILTITANEGKVQTTATVKVVANSGGGSTKPDTPSDAKIPVSAINLTATETCYKLKVGNSYTIETNILPNDATDKTLKWEVVSADDPNDAAKNKIAKTYASVSDTGVVKGLKEGNARIKITATSGVYSYFDIKVISSGNDGYCTTNNNGSSSSGNTGNNTGGNGSNPSGGGTTITKPSSVKFGCSTAEYSNSCQYNVRVLLYGASDLVSNGTIDTFYTCLSNTASGCTNKSAYKKNTWDSISETGSYKYCAYYAKGGNTSDIVCSEYKLITIKKTQEIKITGNDTVKAGDTIKLTAVSTNFNPTNYVWKSNNTSCADVSNKAATTNATATINSSATITSDCAVIITVTATDKNGNSLKATKTITIQKSQDTETVTAPQSVSFACGTNVYSKSCQYNVIPRVSFKGTYGVDYDYAYFCLTTDSSCEPNSSTYTSIKESGTYVYCVSQVKGGKKSSKVCSAKTYIKIKEPKIKISGNSSVKSGSSITLTTNPTNFTPTNYTWSSSNIKCITLGKGNTSTISITGVKNLTANCSSVIKVIATDGSGNKAEDSITINVTKAATNLSAPTVSYSCSSAAYDGSTWCRYGLAVNVNGIPSGATKKLCRVNGTGQCDPFTGTYSTITTSGTYTVCAGYIKDGKNSEVGCKNIVAKIDTTSPTCKMNINGSNVIVTITEKGSGIGAHDNWATIGNTTNQFYKRITSAGSMSFSVKDKVGNQGGCSIMIAEKTQYRLNTCKTFGEYNYSTSDVSDCSSSGTRRKDYTYSVCSKSYKFEGTLYGRCSDGIVVNIKRQIYSSTKENIFSTCRTRLSNECAKRNAELGLGCVNLPIVEYWRKTTYSAKTCSEYNYGEWVDSKPVTTGCNSVLCNLETGKIYVKAS